MPATTISLTTEPYEIPARLKREGQSFSDVITENLRPKPRTGGELLDESERDLQGQKLFNEKLLAQARLGRGRRSNRPIRTK